ncbi:MAG: ABC transporter permease subunit [Spirochaetaceae bacterium]|jgi:NitT/TauT family transport system permease protein|nr:ABC transporter permease subunit [Spirochaetaceae bacterium]
MDKRNWLTGSAAMPVLSALVLLVLWQAASQVIAQPLILPAPTAVLGFLVSHLGDRAFLGHFAASLARVAAAIAVTMTLGTALGILSGLHDGFRSFIAVPLALVRSVPMTAIILAAVFWFGAAMLPVFVAVLMTLPVLCDAVSQGVRSVPRRLLDMARVYGFSRRTVLTQVYLPGIRDHFLAGTRTVLGMSWKVVVAGETLALPRWGAGALLYGAKVRLETAGVFAIALMMTVLCVAMEGLLGDRRGRP